MADKPTVYIVASDQNRNGKTLLSRLVVDYLLLDGKDPFAIDTDAPEGPLRQMFPGRTLLADFAQMQGQMKLFDTILASPGRDYVIDLPVRHMLPFFKALKELDFLNELKTRGFRIIVFFIVDRTQSSLRAAYETSEIKGIDLFAPVVNENVGTSWPDDAALTLQALPRDVAIAISERRFSIRNFVLGDEQGLHEQQRLALNGFLTRALSDLSGLDVELSLQKLRK
ncbi:hypothetical protein [Aestuariivirga litoralis]|uniref:hypothetical protein n=1 Tax=Aestuariivirga litoralis TaxID=2650924 RepID=UPI0018C810E3|nr:hypothetical protein [Aestuariivirga litoralis]MBG1232147.1 hypothetical protein [Aestuariivirga litoralis]